MDTPHKGEYAMGRKSNTPKKRAAAILYNALLIGLFALILFSGWHVVRYYADSHRQETRYDELAALVEAGRQDTSAQDFSQQPPLPEETFAQDSGTGDKPQTQSPEESIILPEYAPLLLLNPDLVGWIEIEDTQINYPVMQSPNEPDFYIDHNFDRQYSSRGCIYAEEACDIFTPSDNVTLYGHHMNDGSMFASLMNYSSSSYLQEHPYIRFDSLTEHHTYEIFAVFVTTATVTKGFPYHNFIDAQDAEVFDSFISGCVSRSIHDTGIVPQFGDKVICLSTCEYSQPNGRFVVCAVRID